MTTSGLPPPPDPVYSVAQPNSAGQVPVYIVYPPTSKGGDNNVPGVGEFDKRLRDVEREVSRISERLLHIPTKSELWKYVIAGGIAPFIAAVWWIVREIVQLHLGAH